MFYSSVILLAFTLILETNADCRESHVTICDKYTDVIDTKSNKPTNPNTSEWTELIIGSEQTLNNTDVIPVQLSVFPFLDFSKLRSLTILGGQIKLHVESSIRSCTFTNGLEVLNLYGHNIGRLKSGMLPGLRQLRQLILKNNGITYLESYAILVSSIEYLDLSDNSIEEIRYNTLPTRPDTAKIIKIKNNKLSFIDKKVFPSSVKVLNLDNNNLRSLPREVFGNLVNLEELTLAHNKFFQLPELDNLKNLKVLDLSHNSLEDLHRNSFEVFDKLASLDLTSNLLEYSESQDSHFLNFILKTPKDKKNVRISVAFNKLIRLPVDYLNSSIPSPYISDIFPSEDRNGYELHLYGNPWNCKYYRENEKFFSDAIDECDKNFFSTGQTPVCFDYNLYYFSDVSYTNEDVINSFVAASKPEKFYKACNMLAHRASVTYKSNYKQEC